jgi:selenocysteine lyase/cysteine desulfurase
MSAMSLEAFRAQFPIFTRRIYVNSCSQGALSVPVEAALASCGIIASARGTGVRISFHAYNSDSDVDAVLHALGAESRWLVRDDVLDRDHV